MNVGRDRAFATAAAATATSTTFFGTSLTGPFMFWWVMWRRRWWMMVWWMMPWWWRTLWFARRWTVLFIFFWTAWWMISGIWGSWSAGYDYIWIRGTGWCWWWWWNVWFAWWTSHRTGWFEFFHSAIAATPCRLLPIYQIRIVYLRIMAFLMIQWCAFGAFNKSILCTQINSTTN